MATVGGTVSEATGGKFANGAVSGAFVHMFNAEGGAAVALNVVGKVWASAYTVAGLAYGGAGYIYGKIMGIDPSISFGHNAIQFINNPFINEHEALTLGNSIIYGLNTGPNTDKSYGESGVLYGPHEEGHTYQYEALGPFYPIAYAIGGGFIGLANPLEQAAQNYAKGGSWWPGSW